MGEARRRRAALRSVEVFREGANTGRGQQRVGLDLWFDRDDRDRPLYRGARLAFQHRSNMASVCRTGGPDGHGSAVELRDTETPNFLLVGRLKRKHEALLCSHQLSPTIVIHV